MSSIGSVLSAFAGAFFSQLAGFIFGRLTPYLGAAAGLILGGSTGLVSLNLVGPVVIPIYKISTSDHFVLFYQASVVFTTVWNAIINFISSIIDYIGFIVAVISNIINFYRFIPIFIEVVEEGPSGRTLTLN